MVNHLIGRAIHQSIIVLFFVCFLGGYGFARARSSLNALAVHSPLKLTHCSFKSASSTSKVHVKSFPYDIHSAKNKLNAKRK